MRTVRLDGGAMTASCERLNLSWSAVSITTGAELNGVRRAAAEKAPRLGLSGVADR
jgi:hypothetical protein